MPTVVCLDPEPHHLQKELPYLKYSENALSVSRKGIGIGGFIMSDGLSDRLSLQEGLPLQLRERLEMAQGKRWKWSKPSYENSNEVPDFSCGN